MLWPLVQYQPLVEHVRDPLRREWRRYQDLVNAPTVYRVKVGKDVIFTCSEMLEKDTGILVGRHHQRAEDGRVVSGSRTKADGRSASVGVVFCS